MEVDIIGSRCADVFYARGEKEDFTWDGLAWLQRNSTNYLNEPYVTGGNPVLAGENVLFNDMLGTTQGSIVQDAKYQAINKTAFGDDSKAGFFTGKPHVAGLGSVFLFRNYRPDQAKWTSPDPIGYPNGWNNLAYCNNKTISCMDPLGLETDWVRDGSEQYVVGRYGWAFGYVDLEPKGWLLGPVEDFFPNIHPTGIVHDALVGWLTGLGIPDLLANFPTMVPAFTYALTLNLYETGALGFEYTVSGVMNGIDITADYFLSQFGAGIDAGFDWRFDPMDDLFSSFDMSSLLDDAFSTMSPTGFPE